MRRAVGLMALAALSAGAYLVFASARGALGFPLDDAWIHQVYARNLATRGELAFFPGQPSAGSTSPLWTILLSLGYVLHLDYRVWAYVLGIALLIASAFWVSRFTFQVSGSFVLRPSSFVFPLFLLFEWHLVWSAVSGMEILLFIFLSLMLVERFYARERAWLIGLLAGLLTLTRPEGIALAALIALGMAFDRDTQSTIRNTQYVLRTAYCVSVLVLVVLPYLAFNWMVSGALFPLSLIHI